MCVMILIFISQFAIVRVEAYSGSQIDIPLLTKPVTIDGKWTSADEWSDAVVVMLINSGGSNPTARAYLYAKHDQSNFYFLVDFVSATVLDAEHDSIGIFFDPLHNGGTVPQSDDRVFVASTPGPGMAIGAAAGGLQLGGWSWNNPLPQGAKVSFSAAFSSSNEAQPHEIAEYLIPFSTFPGMQNTIGFAVNAHHGSAATSDDILALWPADASRDNPSTWGEMTISSTWNVLSDGSRDLISEHGDTVGDLGQTYVDLSQVSYGFSNESLNFRFDLRGKIPNETPTHVTSIWYQVPLDLDPNKGYLWSSDFTPEYMIQLLVEFAESAGPSQTPSVSSSVLKYSGTGSDWNWVKIEGTERLGSNATAAGGVGQDYFVLTCKYQSISSSKGATVRFLARSGILYDDKVYNDYVPNKGVVSIVFNAIPEFSNVWLIIGATLLVSLALIRSRRKSSPKS